MIHKAREEAADATFRNNGDAMKRVKVETKKTATQKTATRAKIVRVGTRKPLSNIRAPWHPDEDKTIVRMVQEGFPWTQIGEALQRSYSSCYSRYCSKLDPYITSSWTTEKLDQLNTMALQGMSWTQIRKELGIRSLVCKKKWVSLGKLSKNHNDQGSHSTAEPSDNPSIALVKRANVRGMYFSKIEFQLLQDLVEKHGQLDDAGQAILEDFKQQSFDRASQRSQISPFTRARLEALTIDDLRYKYLRLSQGKTFWTRDQETSLIQQVLKHGTADDKWEIIATYVGPHSPKECRSHWKKLDMPTQPTVSRWSKTEQSTFWSHWLEHGSDFDTLSKLLYVRSPQDCQQFFDNATRDVYKQDPDIFRNQVQALLDTLPTLDKKVSFSREQSLTLRQALRRYSKTARAKTSRSEMWRWVANKVPGGLSPSSCALHWHYLCQNMDVISGPLEENGARIKPEKNSSWSHEELKLLDQGIRELCPNWRGIQQRYLPWRTSRAIRQRWLYMSDKSIRISEAEYYKILHAGEATEAIDWDELIKEMPGWNNAPCQRVFECSYKHIIRHTVWQPEEDRLLIEKTIEENGRDWHAIAAHFKGIQPAMAPLFNPPLYSPNDPMQPRTRKTAWQCRLRWCQLVEPLMPARLSLNGFFLTPTVDTLLNYSHTTIMAPSDIIIRPATPADVGDILSLIHELAKYEREPASTVEATEESLLKTLRFTPPQPSSQNLASCLLAYLPSNPVEPVGFALYFTNYSTWRGRGGIYLEDLFVKESVRGQRVGRRLLGELAREVTLMNGGRLEWSVLKWNEPSIQFYKSLGAVVMDEWHTMRVDGEALTKLAKDGHGIEGKSTTLM
ncbi:hypothetical protein BGZ94_003205 [Podila epigama]|nr:hypothetical protein BGZ94_003205 [Podila epigama]